MTKLQQIEPARKKSLKDKAKEWFLMVIAGIDCFARRASAYVVEVTPEVAKAWLEMNTGNRPVRHSTVSKYARRMKRDEWMLNGEPIIFDWNNCLLNGQHRLLACIESGVSFNALVILGVDPEGFKTMDNGSGRSGGDVFSIDGIQNANNAAAGVKLAMRLEAGAMQSIAPNERAPSNAELLAWYNDHPEFAELVQLGRKWYDICGRQIMSPSRFAAYAYIMSTRNKKDAMKFMDKLATGAMLENGSPVLYLRRLLIQAKIDPKHRLQPSVITWYVRECWNAYRQGKKVKRINYNPDKKNQGWL